MTFEVHIEMNDNTTAYNKNLGVHLISDDEKTKDFSFDDIIKQLVNDKIHYVILIIPYKCICA